MHFARLTCLLVLCALTRVTHGDGGVFGPSSYRPDIPQQKAIVAFQNNVQTMIIELTFEGSAGQYAWVVPLPGAPLEIKAVTEDVLKEASGKFKPHYLALISPPDGLILLILCVSVTLCLFLVAGAVNAASNPRPRLRLLAWSLAGLSFVVIAGVLLFPLFAQEKSAAGGSPSVETFWSGQAGSYTIDVVRGISSKDLSDWLQRNNTPLPRAAMPIVDDYLQNGFYFMAAKLDHDSDGPRSPHPLFVRTSASEPFYPMRLTSLSSKRLRLDLYVVADGTASADGMSPWISEMVHTVMPRTSQLGDLESISLDNVLWPGCAVTRLNGTFSPINMRRDLEIKLRPFEFVKAQLYDRISVRANAIILSTILFTCSLFLLLFIGVGKRQTSSLLRQAITISLVLALVFGYSPFQSFAML